MVDWNFYDRKFNADGDTLFERLSGVNDGGFLEIAEDSPGVKKVFINDEAFLFAVKSTSYDYKYKFSCLSAKKVQNGSIVKWGDSFWIVGNVYGDTDYYTRGNIYKCNKTLRWQNSNGEIITRWAFVSDSGRGDVEVTSYLSLANNKSDVIIPYDKDTELIPLDKRFMIDVIGGRPNVYEVIKINSEGVVEGESGGVLILTIEKSEYNSSCDNIELKICDYIETDKREAVSGECFINGDLKIRAGGSAKLYSAKFLSSEGELRYDGSPVWDVVFPVEFNDYVFVENRENGILIRISNTSKIIGSNLKIKLSDFGGIYGSTEIDVLVVGLSG